MSSISPSTDERATSAVPSHPALPSTGLMNGSNAEAEVMTSEVFLQRRIKMVEDLWESVLLQECGQELVDLLNQLLSLCSPEGQAENSFEESEALKIVEKLELNEAVRAARAFALYFQIINIVEQHYEQRDQQNLYRAAQESRPDTDRSNGYWAIEAAAHENP